MSVLDCLCGFVRMICCIHLIKSPVLDFVISGHPHRQVHVFHFVMVLDLGPRVLSFEHLNECLFSTLCVCVFL